MISNDIANSLLERFKKLLQPMDGARVLATTATTVTLELNRVDSPYKMRDVGKTHFFEHKESRREADFDKPEPFGLVVEDSDHVYAGYGRLLPYDDEGHGGAFHLEVHFVPPAERAALAAALCESTRAKFEKKPSKKAKAGRTLYESEAQDPFTNQTRSVLRLKSGVIVSHAEPEDTVVPKGGSAPAARAKASAAEKIAKKTTKNGTKRA